MSEYNSTSSIYAETGEFAKLDDYLKNNTVREDHLNNCLISCARMGQTKCVALLIDYGANIHTIVDAPLHAACMNSHVDTIRYLLDSGADLATHNYDIVKQCIRNKINKVLPIFFQYNPKIVYEESLFEDAIMEGNLECVKIFVELGALIPYIGIYLAIAKNECEILIFLMNHGQIIDQIMYNQQIKINRRLETDASDTSSKPIILSTKMIKLLEELGVDP